MSTPDTADQWGPPTRHRADDDIEALASGSFASGRTPNGTTDLLDDAFGTGDDDHYKAPEGGDSSKYSINEEGNEEDKESKSEEADVNPASASDQDEKSVTSTRSDRSMESRGSSKRGSGRDSKLSKSGKSRARETKLAKRTNRIMSDYRAYLSEMENEKENDKENEGETPTDGAAETGDTLALANSEINVPFRDFPKRDLSDNLPAAVGKDGDESSRISSLASGGVSVSLQRGWAYNGDVHDIPLDVIDETDDLDDIREELGLRTRRKYTHPIFHSRKFKLGILCSVLACIVIGAIAGIATSVSKAKKKRHSQNSEAKSVEVQLETEEAPSPQAESQGDEENKPPPAVEPNPSPPTEPNGAETPAEAANPPATNPPPAEAANPPATNPPPVEAANPPATNPPPVEAANPPAPGPSPTEAANSLASEPTLSQQETHDTELKYAYAAQVFHPVWFDRDGGWEGRTYLDAIEFCAAYESYIPCPYEAYCPAGEGNIPLGGMKFELKSSWAPIIDSPNEWVQVGDVDTCMKFTAVNEGQPPMWGLTGDNNEEFTRHLMCCQEPTQVSRGSSNENSITESQPPPNGAETPVDNPSDSAQNSSTGPGAPPELTGTEQDVLDNLHPIWFGRKHGYSGSTHDDAIKFCRNINGMHLCPAEAYCPNGPVIDKKPLFLRMDAFEGEQWAPVSGAENSWILVGEFDDNPASTCQSYTQLRSGLPSWGVDGTSQELKEHIMCCTDPGLDVLSTDSGPSNGLTDTDASGNQGATDSGANVGSESTLGPEAALNGGADREKSIADQMKPVWLDSYNGWNGGSHKDAILYCEGLGIKKQLCPFVAYCPRGTGQAVMGGHFTDFNAEGEQWAPIFGKNNHWVMIGRKHENSATTCLTHEQLEGGPPDWGLDGSRPEIKKHIMCCTLE